MDIDDNNLRQAVEQEWHCKLGDGIKKQILLALDRLTAAESELKLANRDKDGNFRMLQVVTSASDTSIKLLEQERDQLRAQLESAKGREQKHIAELRFTHGGYGCVLSTHVAYALPEGTYKVYADPILPEQTTPAESVQNVKCECDSLLDPWQQMEGSKCSNCISTKVEQVSGGGEPYGYVNENKETQLAEFSFVDWNDGRKWLPVYLAQPSPNKADVPEGFVLLQKEINNETFNEVSKYLRSSFTIAVSEIYSIIKRLNSLPPLKDGSI